MPCLDPGTTNLDIGGIGIIIAFALQAFLSVIFSAWSIVYASKLRASNSRYSLAQKAAWAKKQEILDAILLFASDTQTLNGIALLISGLSQVKGLDFYHLHLVYDTVSFTSISNCAAIVSSFKTLKHHRMIRFMSIIAFLVLYLAFTIAFGVRLRGWNDNKPGNCYKTQDIALASSKHPYVDNIYLAITCVYTVTVLYIASGGGRGPTIRYWGSTSSVVVLGYAVLQCPLHLYSIIALRVANKSSLQGESENTWGFGQVVAMVMFGASLLECCKGYKEWSDWKKGEERGESENEQQVGEIELAEGKIEQRGKENEQAAR